MLDGKACHPAAFFPISLGNFLNIKITVKCRTLTSVTSKLKILLISSCSFHFWYLFRTITIFYDWQGHVTQLCKGPIGRQLESRTRPEMCRTCAQQQKEAPSLRGFIAADRHAFYTDCVLTSELVLYKSKVVLRKSLLLAYNPCKYCHCCYCHLHRRVQCIGYANMRKSTLELAICFDTDCTFSFIAGLVWSSFLFGEKIKVWLN